MEVRRKRNHINNINMEINPLDQEPHSMENSSVTEIIQDSCVVCSNKCFFPKGNSSLSQQISSDELLSLLDTPSYGGKTNLSTCLICLRSVSRLQGIYESLQQIQNTFKELQEDIITKILSRTDDVNNIVQSEAAHNVKNCIYKRWGPILNSRSDKIDESSNNIESLIGSSKIPKGLIISPASPSADVYQHEALHQMEELEEDEEIDRISDPQGIQFHLDLKDFEDSNIRIGSLGGGMIDYVEIPESDEEEEQEMDEEEVNAEDLIPSIEITSFSTSEYPSESSDYLPVNGDSWNDDNLVDEEDQNSTEPFLPSSHTNNGNSLSVKQETSNSTSPLARKHIQHTSSQDLYLNIFGNKSPATAATRFHDEHARPVGLPALSPNFQPTTRKEKRSRPVKKKKPTSNSTKSNPVFNCTVCPLSFRNREQFKEHLEYHKGEAPTCPICKKVFPRKHNLIIHLRTHTGEKPYECPVCQRQYSDRSNFNAHVRKHITKPFACILCGKMFEESSAAHVHATAVHPEHAIGKIISKVTFNKKNKNNS